MVFWAHRMAGSFGQQQVCSQDLAVMSVFLQRWRRAARRRQSVCRPVMKWWAWTLCLSAAPVRRPSLWWRALTRLWPWWSAGTSTKKSLRLAEYDFNLIQHWKCPYFGNRKQLSAWLRCTGWQERIIVISCLKNVKVFLPCRFISDVRAGLLMEMQPDSLTCGPLSACLPLGGKQKPVLCRRVSYFRGQITTQKGVLSISRRDTDPLNVRNSHIYVQEGGASNISESDGVIFIRPSQTVRRFRERV